MEIVDYPRKYFPNFISQSNDLFEELLTQIKWEQYPIKMFGKEYLQPRLIHFMSDTGLEYSYSNTKLQGKGRNKTLLNVKNIVNQTFGLSCNSVLCNLYRDGNDSMGRHSDDEHELGIDPIILSITLGCTRIFKLRHKITKETVTLHLEAGSALLMGSGSQLYREHCLPKTKIAKNKRINLTFRTIIS